MHTFSRNTVAALLVTTVIAVCGRSVPAQVNEGAEWRAVEREKMLMEMEARRAALIGQYASVYTQAQYLVGQAQSWQQVNLYFHLNGHGQLPPHTQPVFLPSPVRVANQLQRIGWQYSQLDAMAAGAKAEYTALESHISRLESEIANGAPAQVAAREAQARLELDRQRAARQARENLKAELRQVAQRTWHSARCGHEVEATFITVRDGRAQLQTDDGREIAVKLGDLCRADQLYVKKKMADWKQLRKLEAEDRG